jgi:spore maturation protein CgeB
MVASVRSSIGIGIPYEIVLVDGGSIDGSIEWMKAQGDIVLIEQGKLVGAVKAFRAGFDAAKGKYVVIANDDISFRYESLRNAIAFMDDRPTVGIGCFPQNRYNADYTVAKMPAVKAGRQVNYWYGQVCIIPKWLGDQVGWWDPGVGYHTYAGDNELSCNVLELGFDVLPMDSCCIDDFVLKDELREINSMSRSGSHPDSEKWKKKWTRNGLLGPVLQPSPRLAVPTRFVPRMVYAPLYEDKFPLQKRTKCGLRDALSKHFLVSEVNYRTNPDELYYAISMFQPQVVLAQVQDARVINYDFMMKVRDEFPKTKFVSWNGDYNEKNLGSPDYMQVMRLFDLATFVTGSVAEDYEEIGINYHYWQIGYEEYTPIPSNQLPSTKYDVVFLGNCYSPQRSKMGERLRRRSQWKVGLFGSWPSHIGKDGINQYDFAAGDAIYRSSKIAIGDNGFPKSIGYASNRLFQALHSGAFLLHQEIPMMKEFLGLENGVHLVTWEDLNHLEAQIEYWLDPARDRERRAIAEQGKRFVDLNHSFDVRVAELLEMLAKVQK